MKRQSKNMMPRERERKKKETLYLRDIQEVEFTNTVNDWDVSRSWRAFSNDTGFYLKW